MIDTVKLRLNYAESPTFNVGQYLDNPKSNMNTETGEYGGVVHLGICTCSIMAVV